jgi:hypothetical protein
MKLNCRPGNIKTTTTATKRHNTVQKKNKTILPK